jgi:hypothetical protein
LPHRGGGKRPECAGIIGKRGKGVKGEKEKMYLFLRRL